MFSASAAVFVSVFAACGESPEVARFAMRDSAGVTVVENHGQAWAEGAGWRVSPTLSLDLSSAGEGPEHRFGRVMDALRRVDGSLVVAEATSLEVRFFDPEGGFLFARSPGQGLPEMEDLSSLALLPGDSVLVFDAATHWVQVLGPGGGEGRRDSLVWSGDLPLASAEVDEDGSIVVRTGWRASTASRAPPGLVRLPMPILRFDGDRLVDTIVVPPGSTVASLQVGPGRSFTTPILGAVTVTGLAGSRLWVGTGERFRLEAFDRAGRLERVVELPEADLSVNDEEVEAIRARRSRGGQGNPIALQLLAQIERALPVPETRPAYGALHVDRLGYLWVGEYPWLGVGVAGATEPVRWRVFDPEGRLLGDLEVPEGFEVKDIGADWVLGVHRVGGGEETVTVYRLDRGD